jgi:flagellar protein FliL
MTEVNEVNFSKGGKMAENGGKGRGGLIRMIVLGLVAILVLAVVGGAAYWFLLKPKPEEKAKAGMRENAPMADSSSELMEHPVYLDLGSFTVNLSEGRRYLKTAIQLELNDDKAAEFLKTRLPDAKDLVIGELQQQTADSLKDPRERELMKQRILTKIQTLLPVPPKDWKDPNPVKKLLITDFLIQ